MTRLPALLTAFDGLSSPGGRAALSADRGRPALLPGRAGVGAGVGGVSNQRSDLRAGIAKVLGWTAGAVSALPAAGLFLFTALLASFFILAGRPALSAFFRQQVPERWLSRLEDTAARLKSALGGWLRAQGILMMVTFLMLGIGFLCMGIDLALLLAAGVPCWTPCPCSARDGVVPWAAAEALGGNYRLCASLLVLYALIWLTRSLLEPKLIADRRDWHPLAALFAMYLGFTLFGVAGLLLAPLAAVVLRQLHDGGVLKLWKQ